MEGETLGGDMEGGTLGGDMEGGGHWEMTWRGEQYK